MTFVDVSITIIRGHFDCPPSSRSSVDLLMPSQHSPSAMDSRYVKEPISSKLNLVAPKGGHEIASLKQHDVGDNASLGDQSILTLEEGVRHALVHWKIVVMGQVLSFLTASMGAAQAGLHLNCSVSAPFFSVAMTFLVLSVFLVPLYQKQKRTSVVDDTGMSMLFGIRLRAPVTVYLLLAAMEVQASYWTISAFRFTTITSITLLDAISLPTVMALSRFLLKRRYMRVHVLGALVCVIGAFVNMLADYTSRQTSAENPYPNRIVGDIFAVSGAMMMGVIHVYSEVLVTDVSGPMEYLGVVGFFAFPLAMAASLIFERNGNVNVFHGSECSGGSIGLLIAASVVAKSLTMIGTAGFLFISEAALLNLSLLTTDLWSASFLILIEGMIPPPLFWVALLVVFVGIFIYELGPSPSPHTHDMHPLEDLYSDEHHIGGVI